MALKEIIGFPTALYYILFRALNFNFSANKFFLEKKQEYGHLDNVLKSNHSALSYFEQGEGNFGICGDAFIQGPAQCHFQ